jgi:hypothetical protein
MWTVLLAVSNGKTMAPNANVEQQDGDVDSIWVELRFVPETRMV